MSLNFEANELSSGSVISIIAEATKVDLTVVGTATSPEFVYPMKDSASLLPDPLNFGVLMIPYYQAQHIFDMNGQINQIIVEFNSGADREEVIKEIENILDPYGRLAAYPADDQLSHAMVEAELEQIESMSTAMPVIFLGIAGAIQFIILRRMVRTHRSQIGILKAIGYNSNQVMWHYILYAVAVALLGHPWVL